jgi:hypothetical protein
MSYTISSTAGGNWESLDKKSLTVSMAEPAREEGLLHEYSEWTVLWIRIQVVRLITLMRIRIRIFI